MRTRLSLLGAVLFLGPGLWLFAQQAHARATGVRVEGTVVDPGEMKRGYNPVVEYEWQGEKHRVRSDWPPLWSKNDPPPAGLRIAVFVPPNDPARARLGRPVEWFFLPGGVTLLGGVLFAAFLVKVRQPRGPAPDAGPGPAG